ncbi:Ribosomal protein L33 [Moritella viscosa]|uniref:Ribosomal protein L33 n=1 Tax=Moritella viscosa TaxID=80854 RepID=A0ABY1HEM1_9GAMM|nr:Ribosomal protein L33 [Moritella viscosa]SGY92210.1 Ribosomal protein L33 [Moritella viscosa]SGY95972.1 Ribosomal protein L33 [Moritella viscosa]SHO04964.1 Ribosomal protein L33 [Moritella viscosa]SHO25678.1 Ribosomal protein L33 [Moritella viscosa]
MKELFYLTYKHNENKSIKIRSLKTNQSNTNKVEIKKYRDEYRRGSKEKLLNQFFDGVWRPVTVNK